MSAQPSPAVRFRRALQSRSATRAMTSAMEMGRGLDLNEALALVQLLSEKSDRAFDRAAGRWVGRLSVEKRLTLGQVELAAGAMARIGERWDDEGAEHALLELLAT